jgi:hypothetical protein
LPGSSKTGDGKCPLSLPPPPSSSHPSTNSKRRPSPSSPGFADCPDPIKGNINSKKREDLPYSEEPVLNSNYHRDREGRKMGLY